MSGVDERVVRLLEAALDKARNGLVRIDETELRHHDHDLDEDYLGFRRRPYRSPETSIVLRVEVFGPFVISDENDRRLPPRAVPMLPAGPYEAEFIDDEGKPIT